MAIENITDAVMLEELVKQIASLTILFQAIGGLIILYLIFNIINAFMNRKKNKELRNINKNLDDIKRLLSKKKR
jgi:hypothetical protein